jgi:adenylate cyclase
MAFSGRASEAMPYLEDAIRLSPYDPNMGSFLVRLADASYFMERYVDAATWAHKALRQPGFQRSRHAVLIAAQARLGNLDQAAAAHATVAERKPDFSLDYVRKRHLIADPDDLAAHLEGLRLDGVPEGAG